MVNRGGVHSRCHHCQEYFTAATIDVSMYVNLSVKELFYELPIEEFLSQREKLEAEHLEGIELMTRRTQSLKTVADEQSIS